MPASTLPLLTESMGHTAVHAKRKINNCFIVGYACVYTAFTDRIVGHITVDKRQK